VYRSVSVTKVRKYFCRLGRHFAQVVCGEQHVTNVTYENGRDRRAKIFAYCDDCQIDNCVICNCAV